SDVVLQHLPAGMTFTQALAAVDSQTLLTALDALTDELRRLDLSHGNLKAENLRWCGGRWIPIRYHYARLGAGDDTSAVELLRTKIQRGTTGQQTMHDIQAPYNNPCDRLTGHRWVGNVFEQLICVEDPTGYGYVDTANQPVIAAQYVWADDFHEGRAAVETPQGMGLIDKTGRAVIAARYEIVEYDPTTGHSQVRLNGAWADFDYQGEQQTNFKLTN
ncbi:MAG: WG repeat-containing protein, partial [Alistipes sp.]